MIKKNTVFIVIILIVAIHTKSEFTKCFMIAGISVKTSTNLLSATVCIFISCNICESISERNKNHK